MNNATLVYLKMIEIISKCKTEKEKEIEITKLKATYPKEMCVLGSCTIIEQILIKNAILKIDTLLNCIEKVENITKEEINAFKKTNKDRLESMLSFEINREKLAKTPLILNQLTKDLPVKEKKFLAHRCPNETWVIVQFNW